jgi:hypothetical protein
LQIATFWLLLGVPGYALLRRFQAQALEGGLLGIVALSYLASFVLLSPVSIVGYAFHLPLAALSGAIVVAVVGAVAWLIRDLVCSPRWPRLSPVALLGSLVIAADMRMGLRVGGYFAGDAKYHMARIRMLHTYGFNSWDPLVSGHRFDPVYHSNLYHALIASAGQLTGLSAPEAWAFTLFWAKLAAAAATFRLAEVMFGQPWLAWCAAVVFAISMAPSQVLLYPNTLAVYALLPLGLAFAIEALSVERRLHAAIGLAATAVVLVEVHALYYIFLCLLVAPLLLGCIARSWLRQLRGRRELLVALLALGLGAPWFGVRMWSRHTSAPAPTAVRSATVEPPPVVSAQSPFPEPASSYKGFVRLEGGRLMLDPAVFVDPASQPLQLLIALVVGAFSRRRPQFVALGCMIGTALVVLYVPAICTAVVHASGAAWIVRRLSAVLVAVHFALFPGVAALVIMERFSPGPRALWREALRLIALFGAFAFAYTNLPPKTRRAYVWQERNGERLRKNLAKCAGLHAFFARNIPRSAVVAAPLNAARDLVVNCDCYPLALPVDQGMRGVSDIAQRREDVGQLVGPGAGLFTRVALLRRYGVRHVYYAGNSLFLWRMAKVYRGITVKTDGSGSRRILTLDAKKYR